MSHFAGFYKKTRQERIDKLGQARDLSAESLDILEKDSNLSEAIAGKLAENHLGTFSLPFSVVPECLVDGIAYSVPMVTEEPSVVAAASFASKMIQRAGGCTTTVHDRLMIGQVALYDVPDTDKAQETIAHHSQTLLELANAAHPSIVKRGGGAHMLTTEVKGEFLIAYLHVDVQEAMGANILNTMLEALKAPLEELTGGSALMAILSNYATSSLVTSTCRIPISLLSPNSQTAQETAKKLELASQLAQVDPYRAATHNKGIFNGIDAVVLATGNDWRAIEAGSHAFASKDGAYKGLSTWTVEGDVLVGSLTLPMPIATVGGSIGLNPKVNATFDILGHPTAKTLASIIVSIGLCQNFAALRALVTTGIQQGHMKLHAKSLALLAGATEAEVDTIAKQLEHQTHRNLETAQRLLATHRQEKSEG